MRFSKFTLKSTSTEGPFSSSGNHQDSETAKNKSSAPVQGPHSPGTPFEAEPTQVDQIIPLSQTQSAIPDAESELTQAQTMSTTDSERTLIASSPPATSGSSTSMPSIPPLLPTATETPGYNVLKRKRESFADEPRLFDDIQMDEEQSIRRPRMESYAPDDEDAPSGLGWLLLPFKAFVKGFKESLTTLDS